MSRERLLAVGAVALVAACSTAVQGPAPHRQQHVAAFIGDSYTAPLGGMTYWQTTAVKMCWQALPFGVPGTGYAMSSVDGRGPYGTRVDSVAAWKPDIVIVQGSFNDIDPARVYTAATAMFKDIHAKIPAARVFAMGPVTPEIPDAFNVGRLVQAVKKAADENFVVFIDARGFLTDPSMFSADRVHPTGAGQKLLGTELADALPAELNSCDTPDDDG